MQMPIAALDRSTAHTRSLNLDVPTLVEPLRGRLYTTPRMMMILRRTIRVGKCSYVYFMLPPPCPFLNPHSYEPMSWEFPKQRSGFVEDLLLRHGSYSADRLAERSLGACATRRKATGSITSSGTSPAAGSLGHLGLPRCWSSNPRRRS